MDCYLLTLYVSLEQELAIRELFAFNGWNFNKHEDSSYQNFTSKQVAATFRKTSDTSQTEKGFLVGESRAVKNVDLDADEQTEIFSDLQHFVEATLIAVNTEVDKTHQKAGNESQDDTEPHVCESNQKNTSGSVNSTDRNATGTRYDNFDTSPSISVNGSGKNISNHSLDTNDDVKRIQETSDGTGTDMIDKHSSNSGTSKENLIVNVSSAATSCCNISNSDTCYKITRHLLLSEANKGLDASTKFTKNSNVVTDIGEVLKDDTRPIDTEKTILLTLDTTESFKIGKNKIENLRKSDWRRKRSKIKNEPKGKPKIKEKKLQNRENDNISGNTIKSRKKGKVGLFHCKECDYTFRFLGAFKNHQKNGKCLFKCEFCGKTFTSRYYSNYLSHLKYHLNDRPHKCEVCGKSYIEAQTLKIHMRKHSGERPYICHHCGRQFYSSSNLLCHRNNAHNDTREIHKCDICDATLSTIGNLRVHKKVVHAAERPFTCEICGKSFKTQKSLEQVHSKVHSEDFPYKCDFIECGKMFKRSEGLTDHMRRHNNDRNHFCESCGKGFYSNKDLRLHTRVHTGEKPHSCELCDYKCALAGNLRKHMKTHV